MPPSSSSRIELHNVSQTFTHNAHKVQLFHKLSLCIEQGQSYAITGAACRLDCVAQKQQPGYGNAAAQQFLRANYPALCAS